MMKLNLAIMTMINVSNDEDGASTDVKMYFNGLQDGDGGDEY